MRAVLFFALSAASAQLAFGWGCEGHQMVALIARSHLTKTAAAAVDKLLAENPTTQALNPYCKDVPPDPMAIASTWADDVRRDEKNGTWHYVDIPLDAADHSGSLDAWCEPVGPARKDGTKPGCVTSAIAYEVGLLRDPKTAPVERTNALRYVIHFVGDIHQPLHASDNEDAGGNCTSFKFFDEPNAWNLHAIWDFKLIQRDLAARKQSQADYAREVDAEYGSKLGPLAGVTDPVKWAWEGHALALKTTYGAFQTAIPVEKGGSKVACEVERNKVAALGIRIGSDYYDQSIPTVREALAKAGARLATLLNASF